MDPPGAAADIVLVDDDPTDAELLEIVLQDAGFGGRLAWYRDPHQALQVLGRASGVPGLRAFPAVVFADLKMPRMSGVEFIQALRAIPSLQFLPVVVLSSSTHPEEIRAAYAAGAQAFVLKSTDFQLFADSIRAAATFWWRCNRLPVP